MFSHTRSSEAYTYPRDSHAMSNCRVNTGELYKLLVLLLCVGRKLVANCYMSI